MSKRVIFGVAGAALLVAGVLVGMIFSDSLRALAAGTPTAGANKQAQTGYCQLYEDTLASQLGVTSDKLKASQQAAAQKVIDQMAADGKITASEQARLTQALKNRAANACAFVRAAAGKRLVASYAGRVLQGSRSAIESAVAAKLNLTQGQLDANLASGQTVTQIATAQKVDISSVNDAYLGAVKSALDGAARSGQLTQDQSSAIYTRVRKAVQNGHYPLLEGGKHQPAK